MDKISKILATDFSKDYHQGGLSVSVVDKVEIPNGVEFLVRAYKNGKQLGFGDGSIDIERFKFYNPPLLAPTGKKRSVVDEHGQREIDEFMESPYLALMQSLVHNISLCGKESGVIVPNKVGNTVSTFYPGAAAVNGVTFQSYGTGGGQAWATIRGLATSSNVVSNPAADTICVQLQTDNAASQWRSMARSFFLFDTTALPSADTINSATLSVYGSLKTTNANIPTQSLVPVATTPASDTALTTADYDQVGTTAFATAMSFTDFSTTGYNDFTLNASGLSAIVKAGITKYGFRLESDRSNTEPSVSVWNEDLTRVFVYYVDNTGTTQDPKLVVDHTNGATVSGNRGDMLLLGIGS